MLRHVSNLLGATVALVVFAAISPAEDMVKIKLDLPDPDFSGTPIDYYSKNLETKSFKHPEFTAPAGTAVISKGAKVTASAPPTLGALSQITDGDKNYIAKSVVELPAGPQWVQVDLGAEKTVHAIALWHWHQGDRVYFDVVVQVSNDPDFKKDVVTLYNNDLDNTSGLGAGPDKEYFDTNQGRLIAGKSTNARYVRLYSNGNNANENNTYIEAEIWGK